MKQQKLIELANQIIQANEAIGVASQEWDSLHAQMMNAFRRKQIAELAKKNLRIEQKILLLQLEQEAAQ
jgi:hypothetical protein